MRIHWTLRNSVLLLLSIGCIASLPVILSIGSQQPPQLLLIITILSALLFYQLYLSINISSKKGLATLSWNKDRWTYQANDKIIVGYQSKFSFTIGPLLYLKIDNEYAQSEAIWLVTDSIIDTYTTGFVPLFPNTLADSKINIIIRGWCHLKCCFLLSEQ